MSYKKIMKECEELEEQLEEAFNCWLFQALKVMEELFIYGIECKISQSIESGFEYTPPEQTFFRRKEKVKPGQLPYDLIEDITQEPSIPKDLAENSKTFTELFKKYPHKIFDQFSAVERTYNGTDEQLSFNPQFFKTSVMQELLSRLELSWMKNNEIIKVPSLKINKL